MDFLSLLGVLSKPEVQAALRDPMFGLKLQQDPNYLHRLALGLPTVDPLPPAPAGAQQSPVAATALSPDEETLLRLYREFAKKPEGQQLVASLGKLQRYVQSEVSKAPESGQ